MMEHTSHSNKVPSVSRVDLKVNGKLFKSTSVKNYSSFQSERNRSAQVSTLTPEEAGSNGDRNEVKPSSQRADENAHNRLEGFMIVHAKKSLQKRRSTLFRTTKSCYYVVSDARRPLLEFYGDETCQEPLYILSLIDATLSFESDDANIVMEKCFCVNVHTWKKRDTVYFQQQGFLFFAEDQAKMLIWVKCIHLAIKLAGSVAANLLEAENNLFRGSGNHSGTLEITGAGEEYLESSFEIGREQDEDDASNKLYERRNNIPVRSIFTPVSMSHSLMREDGVKQNEILISNTSRECKTQWARWNRILSPKHSQKAAEISASTVSCDRPDTGSSSVVKEKILQNATRKIISGLHMSRSGVGHQTKGFVTGKSAIMAREATSLYTSETALEDSIKTNLMLIKGELRSARLDQTQDGDFPAFCKDDVYSSNPVTNIFDWERLHVVGRSAHTQKAFMLITICIAGHYKKSVFYPIAVAGVLTIRSCEAYLYEVKSQDQHSLSFDAMKQFYWISLGCLATYASSLVQLSLGISTMFAVLYIWSVVTLQIKKRLMQKARNSLNVDSSIWPIHQVAADVPNWIRHPDIDRVDWLNRVFSTGWPYVKVAIRNSLMQRLTTLLESKKPSFISTLSMVQMDLGLTNPQISGVKFVRAETITEEVTLDIEVRIVADRSFLVQLKIVTGVGAAAIISLRDLFLVGTLRVTLHPLWHEWPCFSALSLSFTSQPAFDFSIKAAKINLANVPFASDWLHTFLHDLLTDYVVWPKVVTIPLWEQNKHDG